MCCDSWGRKESDTSEQLNSTECPYLYFLFILKSILPEHSYSCYPVIFICMKFFPPLQFLSVCIICLKWFSYRQHIVGSCFIIQSATLCLLIRAFSP